MADLPLGWWTDLAVLSLSGADVDRRTDHVRVRLARDRPRDWDSFVLVTDPGRVSDPAYALGLFTDAFPALDHRAIGLVAEPDPAPWEAAGLVVEQEDVLVSTAPVPLRELAPGHVVRRLTVRDDPVQQRLLDTGRAAWFGAFDGADLVAELGIVDCGDGVARFRSVLTRPDHRRRGLAGHLLGVAAAWAAGRDVERWVIVADRGSAASRLYRSVGFAPHAISHQAFRDEPAAAPGRDGGRRVRPPRRRHA